MRPEPPLKAFLDIWPAASRDRRDRVVSAWGLLTGAEQAEAVRRAPDFLQLLARFKRSTVPEADVYLRDKRWESMP